MLFEYSYDKMNHVLELFNKGEIASLIIEKVNNGNEEVFAIDFKEVSEYTLKEKQNITKLLSESLPERLNAISVLNTFLEHQSTNSTKDFSFRFNVANVNKCEFIYSYAFGASTEITLYKQLQNSLKNVELIITKMGISHTAIPNVYRRDRGKKYSTMEISEILRYLRAGLIQE